jgi:hypothetical protein
MHAALDQPLYFCIWNCYPLRAFCGCVCRFSREPIMCEPAFVCITTFSFELNNEIERNTVSLVYNQLLQKQSK